MVTPVQKKSPPGWRCAVWSGLVAAVVLTLILHFGYILVGSNFRTVVPGKIYRTAQLSADDLEQIIQQKGIRTVLNLRGTCNP